MPEKLQFHLKTLLLENITLQLFYGIQNIMKAVMQVQFLK